MRVCILLFLALFANQIDLPGQEIWFGSTRAITQDYNRFIDLGDIMGEFYLTPVIESYIVDGDSVYLKGFVHYTFERRPNVSIAIISKAKKRKICEKICKLDIYVLTKYIAVTDPNGAFEIKTGLGTPYLLFNDLKRNEYRILTFSIKDTR